MKRTLTVVVLTLLATTMVSRPAQAQSGLPPTDIAVSELVPVKNGGPVRLCPGSANAVRVSVSLSGSAPARAVSLRLILMIPGGSTAGTLIAEGSVTLRPDAAVTTFTFLHVEVPERLRGRGAVLVARANNDLQIAEANLSNNSRQLSIDTATDWTC